MWLDGRSVASRVWHLRGKSDTSLLADVLINFYLTSDNNQMHICEVQVAHHMFYTARKKMPGHSVYVRVRNASELLEYVGVEALQDPRARFRAAKELFGNGWTAANLLRVGFNTSFVALLSSHGSNAEQRTVVRPPLEDEFPERLNLKPLDEQSRQMVRVNLDPKMQEGTATIYAYPSHDTYFTSDISPLSLMTLSEESRKAASIPQMATHYAYASPSEVSKGVDLKWLPDQLKNWLHRRAQAKHAHTHASLSDECSPLFAVGLTATFRSTKTPTCCSRCCACAQTVTAISCSMAHTSLGKSSRSNLSSSDRESFAKQESRSFSRLASSTRHGSRRMRRWA